MSKTWTDEDIEQLTQLAVTDGLKPKEIAPIMGRSRSAILGKLQRLGVAGYTFSPSRSHYGNASTDYTRPTQERPQPSAPRRFSWELDTTA